MRARRAVAWATILVGATPALAQDGAPSLPEDLTLRFSYFHQTGRGYQSQATGTGGPPGDEGLHVFQTIFTTRYEQSEGVDVTVTVPIDVVSSASVDALDAVSSASKWNQAAAIETTVEVSPTDDDTFAVTGRAHIEEILWSGMVGLAYTRELAEDNAALSVSGYYIGDLRDPVDPQGSGPGLTDRHTFNANLSLTQILSRTTLFGATYGLTYQRGRLETFWNSTPTDGNLPTPEGHTRVQERFPSRRTRHALGLLLAQRIPRTGTTLRFRYRWYDDDFGVAAHTARVTAFETLSERILLRTHYRFHRQTGVDFFRTSAPANWPDDAPITSDSDLAPFDAHEWGLALRWMLHLPFEGRADHLELGYRWYGRTNDLRINALSLSYAAIF